MKDDYTGLWIPVEIMKGIVWDVKRIQLSTFLFS
jgi:hypothetical protein